MGELSRTAKFYRDNKSARLKKSAYHKANKTISRYI